MIDQIQRQLPLLLKDNLFGYPGRLATLFVPGPSLRQIQSPAQNRISLLAHMMETHRHLTIARFAQRPGVLPIHTHGILALFGKPGVVHYPGRIGFQLRGHPLSQPRPDFLPLPRALPDELLHRLHIPIRQAGRHRPDRLSFPVLQQTAHIEFSPMPPLAAADWLQQVEQESLQPLTRLGDLVLGHARAYQYQNVAPILNVVILVSCPRNT